MVISLTPRFEKRSTELKITAWLHRDQETPLPKGVFTGTIWIQENNVHGLPQRGGKKCFYWHNMALRQDCGWKTRLEQNVGLELLAQKYCFLKNTRKQILFWRHSSEASQSEPRSPLVPSTKHIFRFFVRVPTKEYWSAGWRGSIQRPEAEKKVK